MEIVNAKDLTSDYLTCLIYGVPGMGKTTLLGKLPGKTLIIDVDQGTKVLRGCENVDVVYIPENLKEINSFLGELSTKSEYQNVAVDSLSEFEAKMLAYFGQQSRNDGVPGIQDYLKVNMGISYLCRKLRTFKCNIVFTAWEDQCEIIASTGDKYTQKRPLLRDKIVNNICGLCDIVGRIVVKPENGERYVVLEGSNDAVAKDRIYKRKECKFEELIPKEEFIND